MTANQTVPANVAQLPDWAKEVYPKIIALVAGKRVSEAKQLLGVVRENVDNTSICFPVVEEKVTFSKDDPKEVTISKIQSALDVLKNELKEKGIGITFDTVNTNEHLIDSLEYLRKRMAGPFNANWFR